MLWGSLNKHLSDHLCERWGYSCENSVVSAPQNAQSSEKYTILEHASVGFNNHLQDRD